MDDDSRDPTSKSRWRTAESYLGALAERDFRLLYVGRIVSVIGDRIAPIALAFAIIGLTGSAADLGYVLSARVAAMVAFLLVGGVWADRLPRRFVLIGTDLLRLGTQGLTATLLLLGSATIWELALLQAIAGLGQAFFRPASTGLIPSIVSPGRLQQANALLGVSQQASTIIGPAIAAAIVAIVGPSWGLAADAATYLVSALFLARLSLVEAARASRSSFFVDLKHGWNEFRSRHWLVALVAEYGLYHLAVFSPFYVLGPLISAEDLGGAGAWGVILVVYGLGAIGGGAAGLRLRPQRPLLVVALLFILDAPPLLALAYTTSTGLIAVAALFSGAASGYGAAVWETTLQQRVPAEALSRVSSYDWLGSMALLPLGYAIAGPVAAAIGVTVVLTIGAILQLASVPLLLAVPSIRSTEPNYDKPKSP